MSVCAYTYVLTCMCIHVRTHGIMKLVFLSIENTLSRSICHFLRYCLLTPVNKVPMGISYIRMYVCTYGCMCTSHDSVVVFRKTFINNDIHDDC